MDVVVFENFISKCAFNGNKLTGFTESTVHMAYNKLTRNM